MSTFLSRRFPRDLSASSFLSLDLSAARERTLDIDVKHARLGEFHGRQCETLPEGIRGVDCCLRGDGSGFHVEVARPRTHAAGIRYRFPCHHPSVLALADFGHSGPRADIDMISDSDCQRGFWKG